MKRWLVPLAFFAMLAASERARADEPRDALAAEALFSEARTLIKDGRWEDACPKLESSLALDPALGTLLNLAECYAKVGKTASAWLRYREAAAVALQSGQKERETIARDRAKALEGELCRLTVKAPPLDGLVMKRDGAASLTNVPVPIDPGSHEIVVEAPGYEPFATRVLAVDRCDALTVDVPQTLGGARAAAPTPKPMLPLDASPAPVPGQHGWRAQHTLAIAVGAVGLVGVALGAGFALDADATNKEGRSKCTPECGSDARALIDDAGRSADIATVSFITAGVFLAGAAVLWLTSPSLSK